MFIYIFCAFLVFFPFVVEKDFQVLKKMMSTCEFHVKYGQNTKKNKVVGKTAIFWGQKGRGFYFVSCCMTSFMNGPYNLIGDH